MSGPLGVLASNIHLATRNPKFRTEIEPECDEDVFVLVFTEFGSKIQKFRAEIEPVCGEDLFFRSAPEIPG